MTTTAATETDPTVSPEPAPTPESNADAGAGGERASIADGLAKLNEGVAREQQPPSQAPPVRAPEPSERTVFERVQAVLREMPAIPKDGTAPGSMGGYSFRKIEDVAAALKPLLAKHGVLMVPSVVEREEMARSTAANKALYVVDLRIRYRFYGPTGDYFDAEMWGEGSDSGDKATQKAVTSSWKSTLGIMFCISDSESDAEAHDVPETMARPAPAEKERVSALVKRVAAAGLGQWVKDQGFPWPWTTAACESIEAKCAGSEGENADETAFDTPLAASAPEDATGVPIPLERAQAAVADMAPTQVTEALKAFSVGGIDPVPGMPPRTDEVHREKLVTLLAQRVVCAECGLLRDGPAMVDETLCDCETA